MIMNHLLFQMRKNLEMPKPWSAVSLVQNYCEKFSEELNIQIESQCYGYVHSIQQDRFISYKH